MNNAFCTITTQSHLPKVFALYTSLYSHNPNVSLQVLVIDGKIAVEKMKLFEMIEFYDISILEDDKVSQKILNKDKKKSDKLRWSLKPIFLKWLLKKKYDKVIYVDNDIYFVDQFDFLFEELDKNNVLLSPHWRPENPSEEPLWFETNFRDGIFNAGFFGCNKNSIKALDWWASACLYKCEKNYRHGLFDDQKYLDMMPVIEKNTGIIHHKGCNLAYWNIKQVKRKLQSGKLILSGEYNPVFIHFADCTIAAILRNEDILLESHLKLYLEQLQNFGFKLNLNSILRKENFWAVYRNIKWKIFGDFLF